MVNPAQAVILHWFVPTRQSTFPDSSMVERAAVNREVRGSTPSRGAFTAGRDSQGSLPVRIMGVDASSPTEPERVPARRDEPPGSREKKRVRSSLSLMNHPQHAAPLSGIYDQTTWTTSVSDLTTSNSSHLEYGASTVFPCGRGPRSMLTLPHGTTWPEAVSETDKRVLTLFPTPDCQRCRAEQQMLQFRTQLSGRIRDAARVVL